MGQRVDPRIANMPPNPIASGMDADTFFTMSTSSQPQDLVEGVLYVSPPAGEAQEDCVARLGHALREFARQDGGQVLRGKDCRLDDKTVLRPDLGYLLPERAHLAGSYVRGAPDLAIEVMSFGSAGFDTGAKRPAYLAAGAREVWLVDLAQETVTVVSGGSFPAPDITVTFGERIPSLIVDVGPGNLERDG